MLNTGGENTPFFSQRLINGIRKSVDHRTSITLAKETKMKTKTKEKKPKPNNIAKKNTNNFLQTHQDLSYAK